MADECNTLPTAVNLLTGDIVHDPRPHTKRECMLHTLRNAEQVVRTRCADGNVSQIDALLTLMHAEGRRALALIDRFAASGLRPGVAHPDGDRVDVDRMYQIDSERAYQLRLTLCDNYLTAFGEVEALAPDRSWLWRSVFGTSSYMTAEEQTTSRDDDVATTGSFASLVPRVPDGGCDVGRACLS